VTCDQIYNTNSNRRQFFYVQGWRCSPARQGPKCSVGTANGPRDGSSTLTGRVVPKYIPLAKSTNNLIVCPIAPRPRTRRIERRCWWSSIPLDLTLLAHPLVRSREAALRGRADVVKRSNRMIVCSPVHTRGRSGSQHRWLLAPSTLQRRLTCASQCRSCLAPLNTFGPAPQWTPSPSREWMNVILSLGSCQKDMSSV
jgi:hypothetical protein